MTLVPAMATDVAHIVMLQRSPTYVVSRPDTRRDRERAAHRAARALGLRHHALEERRAAAVPLPPHAHASRRRSSRSSSTWCARSSGPTTTSTTHFTPRYNPWDQRLCLVPNSDLFEAIRSGKASIVTDQIERFTETGITLDVRHGARGRHHRDGDGPQPRRAGRDAVRRRRRRRRFRADVDLQGHDVLRRAEPGLHVRLHQRLVDAAGGPHRRVRLPAAQPHGRDRHAPGDAAAARRSTATCRPARGSTSFSSGYMQRMMHRFPKQGDHEPWINPQNYGARPEDDPTRPARGRCARVRQPEARRPAARPASASRAAVRAAAAPALTRPPGAQAVALFAGSGRRHSLRHQVADREPHQAAEQHLRHLVEPVLEPAQLRMVRQAGRDDDGRRDRRLAPHGRDADHVGRDEHGHRQGERQLPLARSADERKSSPTAQPTSTLTTRLRNMRTASFSCGSEAAIIEAMAQIGFVSVMRRRTEPEDRRCDEDVDGEANAEQVALREVWPLHGSIAAPGITRARAADCPSNGTPRPSWSPRGRSSPSPHTGARGRTPRHAGGPSRAGPAAA